MADYKDIVKTQNHRNKQKSFKNKEFTSKDPIHVKGTSIEVRFGDVNGAIRKLKKVLERADRQKELSKREYYEKPSVKRKRMADNAVKKHKKEVNDMILKGDYMPTSTVGQKHLKGKREKRRAWLQREKLQRLQRRRGR
jgi:ribosomal protein S21